MAENANESYQTAYQHYENEQYEAAIPLLEKLVEAEADNADFHHLLARCYGRRAEQVNWFSAIKYAEKTREHLELAVDLDSQNVEILDDMMDYYREAPGFLGGDKKKADEIEALINKISGNNDINVNYYGKN